MKIIIFQTLLDDAMRDLSIGSAPHNRSSSFSTDEEFFMVEDIPGCGITVSYFSIFSLLFFFILVHFNPFSVIKW